ncbi:DegQ family serine endoprotease [Candidatus Endowatersipora endosymbiont of Watersipora subatra]|uniref:DegQ family serine endoprotease n=1 Tax=Candidatus Endowatersipora endosymbiont of Watersipora subatra TaxID=3077946 RepID=UPI00312CAF21
MILGLGAPYLQVRICSFAYASGPASVANLVEGLLGAVVNISTSQNIKVGDSLQKVPRLRTPDGLPFQDFFEDFFKQQQKERDQGNHRHRTQSLGSGFVIDSQGTIVTNNHVIANADEITVDFSDGSKLLAKVIGTDPKTDIAVLKVNPNKPLKAVPFGSSSKARIGDWVMAIGNPFGQGGSVTVGIISAINRDIHSGPYDNFIQTDAAINRGNSGGPLFNMAGEVVGINTAIISPSGGSIGIGFSIPSDLAQNVIAQLREFGETRRGWLGVSIQPITDDIAESLSMRNLEGALVAGIIKNGPAQKSGILIGDVILKFDGKSVLQMRDLPRIVADTAVGKAVDVLVLRKGQKKIISVTLGRLEDGEKRLADHAQSSSNDNSVEALGMGFSELTDENREKFNLDSDIKGVLITRVDPDSYASEKRLRPGSVLLEIGQESVKKPKDVIKRLKELKSEGRKKVLLLILTQDHQSSFVVLNLQ